MTLRTFIEHHYGSFRQFNLTTGWGHNKANKAYRDKPNDFMLVAKKVVEDTGVSYDELVRMIDERENEITEVNAMEWLTTTTPTNGLLNAALANYVGIVTSYILCW